MVNFDPKFWTEQNSTEPPLEQIGCEAEITKVEHSLWYIILLHFNSNCNMFLCYDILITDQFLASNYLVMSWSL